MDAPALAPEAAARLRARARTLAREAAAMAARVKAMEGEIASLRTALALILDELDQLAPVTPVR